MPLAPVPTPTAAEAPPSPLLGASVATALAAACASLVISAITWRLIPEAARWTFATAAVGYAWTTGLLAAGWLLLLGCGRPVQRRHAVWLSLAAIAALLVSGFVSGLVTVPVIEAGRAAGWSYGVISAATSALGDTLRAVLVGVAVALALIAATGPSVPGHGRGTARERATARAVWLLLGLYAGAMFTLRVVFTNQRIRWSDDDAVAALFASNGPGLLAWQLMLAASAAVVAWSALQSMPDRAGRWRAAMFFALAAVMSSVGLLLSFRVSARVLALLDAPAWLLVPTTSVLCMLIGATLPLAIDARVGRARPSVDSSGGF